MATRRLNNTPDFQAPAETLRAATDLISDGFFLIDESGKIIFANNAAQIIIGLPESNLLGFPIASIASLQFPQPGTKSTPGARPTPDILTLPARIHGVSYSATLIPVVGIPSLSESTPLPAAVVILKATPSRDVHDHTTTTIYEQTIGYLTMKIAHDLNNSLTSIIGNAELLDEQLIDLFSSPNPEEIALLKHNGLPELRDVIRKSREMAQFINIIREYARHHSIKTSTADLNNAITETIAIARTLLGPTIQIDFNPSDELAPVQMDRLRIDQLLLSILLSCKKEMPSGGPLTIKTEPATLDREFAETHRGADAGTYARITITDSSKGTDEEQLSSIFDLPAAEDFESCGLGLPIVYSIVKRFNGYLTVVSSATKGRTFSIYIPSIDTSQSVSTPSNELPLESVPDDAYQSPATINRSLILVADDDSDIRQTIARYVSRAGYETVFAADGKTTLELFERLTAERNQPALLIADLGLPEIDGRTLSTLIQKHFRNVRIILTSGFNIDIDPATGTTPEGFTFLEKPFGPNALLATIERLLKAKDDEHTRSSQV